jgi:alpha-1,2-glucosyltransferase
VSRLGQYVLGIAALGMRQTNIFWVAIFLAGMEWVKACKQQTTWVKKKRTSELSAMGELGMMIEEWSNGLLHDPKVGDSGIGGEYSFQP